MCSLTDCMFDLVFWNQQLGFPGPAEQFASVEICKKIMDQHLFSPSMWAIFPIQVTN